MKNFNLARKSNAKGRLNAWPASVNLQQNHCKQTNKTKESCKLFCEQKREIKNYSDVLVKENLT